MDTYRARGVSEEEARVAMINAAAAMSRTFKMKVRQIKGLKVVPGASSTSGPSPAVAETTTTEVATAPEVSKDAAASTAVEVYEVPNALGISTEFKTSEVSNPSEMSKLSRITEVSEELETGGSPGPPGPPKFSGLPEMNVSVVSVEEVGEDDD
ncbi:hypothetical protein Sste5346_008911 [Sporothrix stenoceras]|uniref:Uncharacterized protein n=1 Tax=Sporothrix stenoceras TaxID=5173 RepID=A0ABR3YML9_9PEZI